MINTFIVYKDVEGPKQAVNMWYMKYSKFLFFVSQLCWMDEFWTTSILNYM